MQKPSPHLRFVVPLRRFEPPLLSIHGIFHYLPHAFEPFVPTAVAAAAQVH